MNVWGWGATPSVIDVECDICHTVRQIAVCSTAITPCPRCYSYGIYRPQQEFPFDPEQEARERAEQALLAWPPIADLTDIRRRR